MPVDSQYYQAEQGEPDAGVASPEPEPENDTDRLWRVVYAMRNEQGQWQKGTSGNRAGRPRGARNRATLLAEAVLGASAATIASKAIASAVSGDGVNQRFLLARILAPRRSVPVELDLPPLDTQKDISRAVAAVGKAVAASEITPAEAVELTRLFETAMQAVEKRVKEVRQDRWDRAWARSEAAVPAEGSPAELEAAETEQVAALRGTAPEEDES